MSDLFERAREDLPRLKPSVWTAVYADRLLDELAAGEELARESRAYAERFAALSKVLGHARQATESILAALDAFEASTQWSPGLRRQLKLTPKRWAASMALALATRVAIATFMSASRPALATISGRPSRQSARSAESLEKVVEAAERAAPRTPEVLAKLAGFKESTLKLRDQVIRLKDHPVSWDTRFLKAGSVEALIEKRGQCSSGHAGTTGRRCWFYAGHPGECQFRRKVKLKQEEEPLGWSGSTSITCPHCFAVVPDRPDCRACGKRTD